MVKILSAADPSVSGINSPDEEGWVPLHSAASIGNVEIVEILLSRGEYFVDRSSVKRVTIKLVLFLKAKG